MKESDGVVLSAEQVDAIVQTVEALEYQEKGVNDEVRTLLKGLVDVAGSDRRHIVRSMTFPEVYLQTAVGLLHYFGRVVTFIHPDIPVRLSVTQDGNYVRLWLEVPEKHYALIEESLENYGLALKGRVPLNTVVNDPNQLMEWKQKLDLSALEVKITRDVLESPDGVRGHDIEAFGADATTLHYLVGEGVSGLSALTAAIGVAIEENREKINDALLVLQKKLSEKVKAEDEAEVKQALETILRYEPEVFQQIYDIVVGKEVSGHSADTLLSWIVSLSGVMPR